MKKVFFGDVDFEKIEYDAKANFVIERIFERGCGRHTTMQEILWR
jgi:hypothetical protein